MLKRILTPSDIFSILLVSFVLWRQGPEWMKSYRSEGLTLSSKKYSLLNQEGQILFPPTDSRVIGIFWASWCGPCKAEMSRLESSVKAGKMKPTQIIAINLFEDSVVATKFINDNPYPFTFIHAPESTQQLNVTATPTTIFVDKGVITHRSSGLSIFGIWRAEFFLN